MVLNPALDLVVRDSVASNRDQNYPRRDPPKKSTYITRIPQCLSPRPNWDPPPPHLMKAIVSPPRTKGETHSPAGEGGSTFGRLEKKLSPLSTYSVGDPKAETSSINIWSGSISKVKYSRAIIFFTGETIVTLKFYEQVFPFSKSLNLQ